MKAASGQFQPVPHKRHDVTGAVVGAVRFIVAPVPMLNEPP